MSVSSGGAQLATGQANVQQLGTSIFTTYLFSFEATAALLMIAVIGAVVLARRENAQVATEGDVE
jgi:NADH-quinone oxidoreductase subunit J